MLPTQDNGVQSHMQCWLLCVASNFTSLCCSQETAAGREALHTRASRGPKPSEKSTMPCLKVQPTPRCCAPQGLMGHTCAIRPKAGRLTHSGCTH